MVRHDDVESLILENLVPKIYKSFAKKVIPVSKQRISDIKQHSQIDDIRDIQIKSVRDSCMRIKLRNSLLLFIPESTRLLSRKVLYFEEKRIFAGFLATYVPDLNHFTLLHVLDRERLKQYFLNESFDISRDIYQRLQPKTERLPEFSSLNFLLRYTATNVTQPLKQEIDYLNCCFMYAYWHMPAHNILEEYDSFHNFIYHGYRTIHEICDVFKTLIKIEKIDTAQHRLVFLKNPIKYRHVTAKILYGGTKFNYFETVLIVPESLAIQIRPGDIINGIIANCHKFHTNTHKLILINAVGNIIHTPTTQDLKIPTSIAAHLHCKLKPPIKFIESIDSDKLLSDIEDLLTFDEDFFGTSWRHLLNNDAINVSVTGLNPVMLNYNKTIHIIPPALISYLSQYPKFLRLDLLYEIINLINSIPLRSDHTSRALGHATQSIIRKSDSYAILQKADKSNEICQTLFSDLPYLLNRISYSRILSRSVL